MSTVTDTVKGTETEVTDETPSQEQKLDTETTSETTEEEGEEESTASAEELTEQKEALKLYRDLKGPQGAATLASIAKSQGLTLEGTKSEITQAAKTVAEILEEDLGEGYTFFSKKLGAGLERVIREKILPQVQSAKESSLIAEVNGHLKDIFEDNNIPKSEQDSIRNQIDQLSKELPFSGTGMKVYLNRLYHTVVNEDAKTRKRLERVRRNEEESDEISSEGSQGFRVIKGPKNPSLRQSIEAAARGERYG